MELNNLISECIAATVIFFAIVQVYGDLTLCVHILAAVFIEIYFFFKYIGSDKRTRSNATPGAWVIILIPCIMLQSNHKETADIASASILALIAILFRTDCFFDITVFFSIIVISIQTGINICLSSSVLFICLLSNELLSSFSGSLTVGESILLSQIMLYFLINFPLFIIVFIIAYVVEHFKLIFSILSISRIVLSAIWMWICLFKLAAIYSSSDALLVHFTWINSLFIVENLLLIIMWAPLCMLSIGVVYAYSINTPSMTEQISLTDRSDLLDNGISVVKHPPFQIRKLFHIIAGFVYCTGIMVSPKFLSVAAAGVFIIFLIIEWARRRGPPAVSSALNSALGPFRDSRDTGEIIFTPIALLLGLSLPVWNFGQPFSDSVSAWTGVLTIALGDSIAALVGRAWGGFWKWPFTHRTVIGSLASFVSQLVLWTFISFTSERVWSICLVPLTASVITEAFSEQIDNLVVPLVFMAFLKAPSRQAIGV